MQNKYYLANPSWTNKLIFYIFNKIWSSIGWSFGTHQKCLNWIPASFSVIKGKYQLRIHN